MKRGRSSGAPKKRKRTKQKDSAQVVPRALQTSHNKVLKGVDTSIIDAGITATLTGNTTVFPVNLVQARSGSFGRTDRRIAMMSLRVSGAFNYTYVDSVTTGVLVANEVRMLVVYDKQPSGTLPNINAVLGHTLQDGTEAIAFQDHLRYDNMERFKILRDKSIVLNPVLFNGAAGSTDTTDLLYQVDEFVPLNGALTTYQGDNSPMSIADISSGGLYVILFARTYVAGINLASCQFTARLRYTDH